MSTFTGELTLTELDIAWREWRLEQPLTYEVGALGSGRLIVVPHGFVTDGASVPRILWAVLPAWGRYSRAAVVHDYLCVLLNAGTPHVEGPDRRTADGVFFEAMCACGVNQTWRFVMWAAVRLFATVRGA